MANTDTARERLFAEIDRREDELVALIQRLVRSRSMLGNEAEAQGIVADYIRASGVEPDVWDIDAAMLELPGAGDSGVPFAGRPNVAAVYHGAGGGRSLILNGHVDVVSPEPLENWTRDPWAAAIEGRRMYGRGAYDMKSGLAVNLFVARLIHELGIELGGDLTIQSVIEEECTGNGALAACFRDGASSTRYRADAALIAESTDERYIAAHVGVIWFRVTVIGESAHAMVAWQGVNAIERMMPIIEELRALDAELNREVHPDYAGVEHPINLNVGVIRGGDWPSNVAGDCTIECRLSMFPGVTVEETRARVVEASTARSNGTAGSPSTRRPSSGTASRAPARPSRRRRRFSRCWRATISRCAGTRSSRPTAPARPTCATSSSTPVCRRSAMAAAASEPTRPTNGSTSTRWSRPHASSARQSSTGAAPAALDTPAAPSR